MIANPYEIFARNILELETLKPLGTLPNSALRGQHRASCLARICAEPSRLFA